MSYQAGKAQLAASSFTGPSRPADDGREIWYQRCPSCGSNGWNVYVSTEKGLWYCHKEAKGGRVAGISASPPVQPSLAFPAVEFPATCALGYGARRFLDKRGLPDAVSRALGISETAADGLRGRVLLPYFDRGGKPIWWTARAYSRALTQGQPKYVGCPSARPLYVCGDDDDGQRVVLVEGQFDAIAVWQATGLLAMALGSTRISRRQVHQLTDYWPSSITVMLDGDATSKALGVRAMVRHLAPVQIVALRPGQDPGNVGGGECRRLLETHSLT